MINMMKLINVLMITILTALNIMVVVIKSPFLSQTLANQGVWSRRRQKLVLKPIVRHMESQGRNNNFECLETTHKRAWSVLTRVRIWYPHISVLFFMDMDARIRFKWDQHYGKLNCSVKFSMKQPFHRWYWLTRTIKSFQLPTRHGTG